MRVLHIINSIEIGGAEMLLCDILPELTKRGINIELFLLKESRNNMVQTLIDNGIKIEISNSGMYSLKTIFKIRKKIRSFDIIHSHLFPSQYWAGISTLFLHQRPRLVTTEHSTSNRRRGKLHWRMLDRFIYSRYDIVTTVSEASRNSLCDWIPSIKEKNVVINNGIKINNFIRSDNFEGQSFFNNNDPIIITVGRLEPAKDHITLFKALRLLKNVNLLVVGDGSLREDYESFVINEGLRDRVIFLGKRDDIPKLLNSGTVYVQSSRWEGFGLATAESMAAGLPVIVSDIPALREVVGTCGVFFKPGDEIDLSNKISHLISNSDKITELKEKSREQAEKYNIIKTITGYFELYSNLIKK